MTKKLVITLSASILAVATLATGLIVLFHKKRIRMYNQNKT